MKRIFILVFVLAGFAIAADLQKFTGPAYKTATVINASQVYSSVDAKTSQVGNLIGWAKPGESLEVIGVYSPFVKLKSKSSGWAWVELLTVSGNSATIDQNTEGRLGVALSSLPNNYESITGALGQNELAEIIEYWPRWVKVKFKGGIGLIFATEVKLVQ